MSLAKPGAQPRPYYDFLWNFSFEELLDLSAFALGLAAGNSDVPPWRRIQEMRAFERRLHAVAWSLTQIYPKAVDPAADEKLGPVAPG